MEQPHIYSYWRGTEDTHAVLTKQYYYSLNAPQRECFEAKESCTFKGFFCEKVEGKSSNSSFPDQKKRQKYLISEKFPVIWYFL